MPSDTPVFEREAVGMTPGLVDLLPTLSDRDDVKRVEHTHQCVCVCGERERESSELRASL